jgi:hypothetical protein
VGSTDRDGSPGSFLQGVKVTEIADELGEYCGKVLAGGISYRQGTSVIWTPTLPLDLEGTRPA